jgi:polysaccharide export outer membrane protein
MNKVAQAFAITLAIPAFFLAQAGTCLAQQSNTPAPYAPALIIGSGDLLEINMYDNPDLSGRFRVNEKGDVNLPLIGLVHVEGDTSDEAGTVIEKQFIDADILKPAEAQATVFIAEYATQGILVNGQVKSSGLYPALGIRMFNDVITAAGGVTPLASSKVLITRKSDPEHPVTVDYNPEALTPVIPQIQIFPGDMIMVPRAGIVYVLGRVIRPGGFVLDGRQSLSVEGAMALAGGSGPSAAMGRAHLIRTVDGGKKEDIVLNVNKIQGARAPDIAMKDGDILFIPTSNSKLIMLQAISSALNIGTNVAIYRTAYQSP